MNTGKLIQAEIKHNEVRTGDTNEQDEEQVAEFRSEDKRILGSEGQMTKLTKDCDSNIIEKQKLLNFDKK